MLVDGGYLDRHDRQDAPLMYYIEVKPTTGPSSTPFYMSKHQYQRVSKPHTADGGGSFGS